MTTFFKSFLSVLFVALMTVTLSAQCTFSTGDYTGGFSTPGTNQSFTADCDGNLISFTFDVFNIYGGGTATLDILDGNCFGSVLGSETVSVTSPGDLTFTFSTPIPVVSGNMYGLLISFSGSSVGYMDIRAANSGNPYSGGAHNCQSSGADLEFGYSIDAGSTGGGGNSPVACDNPLPAGGTQASTSGSASSGVSYGQSIVADAGCLGGSDFSEFSFYASGNQTISINIKVYDGETVSGTPMYSEDGFIFPPGNQFGELNTVVFGTGSNATGSLTYVDGQTYTFVIETVNGIHLYWMTGDNIAGKAYTDGAFDASLDLITGIAGGTPSAAVPTMGEWALIILALIMMSLGVVTVMRWKTVQSLQTAGGNAQMSLNIGNTLPFNKKSYFQILPLVWGGLVAVFAIAVAAFGYEMTGADVPGALMAGTVGAYLVHLIKK